MGKNKLIIKIIASANITASDQQGLEHYADAVFIFTTRI
jgi:hypothetical protein